MLTCGVLLNILEWWGMSKADLYSSSAPRALGAACVTTICGWEILAAASNLNVVQGSVSPRPG